jgi:hypothetical protein
MKKLLFKIYVLLLLIISLISCGTSSEIIIKSSKNLNEGEKSIAVSTSLNPTLMPMYVHKDSLTDKITREYINGFGPFNPVLSGQFDYGISNFYNIGGGFDLSIIGGTIFIDNKFELTSNKEYSQHKNFRISYYNKSSFTKGMPFFVANYLPHRVGHFEVGNYIIMGFFFKDIELIITPHVDLNYLISEDDIDSWDYSEDEAVSGKVYNNTIYFTNIGINLGIRTKDNIFIETGIQYISSNSYDLSKNGNKNYQIMIGFGYRMMLDL